ncbi:MAG: [protein-PII] uridylyltransferase [Robiginitomaculum sp.]|nr:[protein-PII] uridylyltransferase [Robiginitomaculum sp.]
MTSLTPTQMHMDKNLYAQLSALDDKSDKKKIIKICQFALQKAVDEIQTKFEAKSLNGIETATAIASAHDDLLQALFTFATKDIFPNKNATTETISLCAVGGYGRGEMAPYSDLDLMFLIASKKPTKRCSEITEYILYMLWDLKLKIGHALRSPEQCIELARTDDTVLSALLDLRLVAGPPEQASILVWLLRKERTRGKIRSYISAKLKARDGRHAKAGNSRYVIEPNIKEGKGGLRDLHELYWIARFVYGKKGSAKTDAPLKPHGVIAYIRHGLLNAKDAKRFNSAAEFLWQVRHNLHYIAGRATESLSFDRQDALAVRMGYTQGAPEDRVAEFMRTYFMTAREVGALTRIACAKLESQSAILLPQGLDRFLPTTRRGLKQPGFVLEHGRLNFASAKALKKNPLYILRLFQIAGARNLDIHPDAFSALLLNMGLIDDDFRANLDASDIFMDILLKSMAPGAVLQTMNEASVLGAYLPEFGAIVARTQFNMHHAYTVDDHTISLIKFLHDLESGELAREHPLVTGFLKDLASRHRKCLYLACLFHDVGKSEGDQCLDGARMARRATQRMGLSDSESDTVSWLVRNHLEMSETAQRRDITDPDTVEGFAKTVGSIARLQMLTALTVVDIKAVGPGIWNDWKGELLRQLYRSARQVLLGDHDAGQEAGADYDLDDLCAQLDPLIAEKIRPMFTSLFSDKGASYWNTTLKDVQVQHAGFFADALASFAKTDNDGAHHFVRTTLNRSKDITELWILSVDRLHLFADITGAIAMCGASVTGAHLHTGDDGLVFNIFYLQNPEGLAFGRQTLRRLEKLEAATLLALNGQGVDQVLPPAIISRRADAIPIHPRASVMMSGIDTAIIEVSGRDRPGLLCDLGRVLADHDLSIRSAHVEVLGPKAIDVFYVAIDAENPLQEQVLQADLMRVLAGQTLTAKQHETAS